jgi:hypothetical protein
MKSMDNVRQRGEAVAPQRQVMGAPPRTGVWWRWRPGGGQHRAWERARRCAAGLCLLGLALLLARGGAGSAVAQALGETIDVQICLWKARQPV